jgi:hypothetical protein
MRSISFHVVIRVDVSVESFYDTPTILLIGEESIVAEPDTPRSRRT